MLHVIRRLPLPSPPVLIDSINILIFPPFSPGFIPLRTIEENLHRRIKPHFRVPFDRYPRRDVVTSDSIRFIRGSGVVFKPSTSRRFRNWMHDKCERENGNMEFQGIRATFCNGARNVDPSVVRLRWTIIIKVKTGRFTGCWWGLTTRLITIVRRTSRAPVFMRGNNVNNAKSVSIDGFFPAGARRESCRG